jgi:hypothetical protein
MGKAVYEQKRIAAKIPHMLTQCRLRLDDTVILTQQMTFRLQSIF